MSSWQFKAHWKNPIYVHYLDANLNKVGRAGVQKKLEANKFNLEEKAINLDPAVEGVALPLLWSQQGKEQQWQLQHRKRRANTWNKLEQNMLRKCFKIQKSYVRWAAPSKTFELWLSHEIPTNEINLMGPVYKSEMQIKMKYKLISDLKCNHKVRGCEWDKNGSGEGQPFPGREVS